MSSAMQIRVLRGRRLSLEGAVPAGAGAAGRVYLLPDDNVVKVLFSDDFQAAEQEILLSKWAFSKGLPTAISYDVVDVDGHPGLVYESLGRDNLRNRLRLHADNPEPVLRQYLEFIRAVNAIEVEDGRLPSAREQLRARFAALKGCLTPEECARSLMLLDTIPEDRHLIHGDCHLKNIKVVKDRLFLIDLDTLSCGDPIFELMGLCCCYYAYRNADAAGYNSFFEIEDALVKKAYFYVLDGYFPSLSAEKKQRNRQRVELLTYLYMLCCLDPAADSELFGDMLRLVREGLPRIKELRLERP